MFSTVTKDVKLKEALNHTLIEEDGTMYLAFTETLTTPYPPKLFSFAAAGFRAAQANIGLILAYVNSMFSSNRVVICGDHERDSNKSEQHHNKTCFSHLLKISTHQLSACYLCHSVFITVVKNSLLSINMKIQVYIHL